MLYALIMAGGRGTRFWPASRTRTPKQLLHLFGDTSVLNHTIDRLRGLIDPAAILIATNTDQACAVKECAPTIPDENIIVEPDCRDTAPCIALAASLVLRRDRDAVLLVAPSDHVIRPTERFHHTVRAAADLASKDAGIFVFGVEPTGPSTAFGYIQRGDELHTQHDVRVFTVSRFTEKPDRADAQAFLESGEYYWNSGLYLFRAEAILEEFRTHAPAIAEGVARITDAVGTPDEAAVLDAVYPQLDKISIDFAVTERAAGVKVLEVDYFWSDVGSWTSIGDMETPDGDGNLVHATHVGIDTKGCIIWQREDHLIATIGVSDLVIIHTPDATLVCDSARVQDVKTLVEMLRERGMDSVL